MKITNLDNSPKIKVDMEGAADVYKQVPISKNDGSSLLSFRVFTIEPQGHTPFHRHPFEHLNYVISGQGTIVDQNHEEHRVKTGDFALVLSDEKHQYRNASDNEPLILICAVEKEYE